MSFLPISEPITNFSKTFKFIIKKTKKILSHIVFPFLIRLENSNVCIMTETDAKDHKKCYTLRYQYTSN